MRAVELADEMARAIEARLAVHRAELPHARLMDYQENGRLSEDARYITERQVDAYEHLLHVESSIAGFERELAKARRAADAYEAELARRLTATARRAVSRLDQDTAAAVESVSCRLAAVEQRLGLARQGGR